MPNSLFFSAAQRISLWALPLLVLITASGCSRFNCTRFEQLIGSETDLITFSYTIADDLTAAAYPPLVTGNPDMVVLVTTFVDNTDLEKTSKFGRIVQEHLGSRLVQLGYAVKEIKMTGQLLIDPKSGETILSRDISKISPSVKSQAILVGTVSLTGRSIYVSARLVQPASSVILSSTDRQLCMDDAILAMFGLQQENSSGEIPEPGRPRLNAILY